MSTIAAIATGLSVGGIGIVRISGENAIKIADSVFRAKSQKPLTQVKGYSALFGTVLDKANNAIDEVVALVFLAPKSYTGEDVVEFSCHGGLFVTKKILRTVFEAGAIPAEAGEFTKRAFLNGKMDLTKAEAVMNIISSHSEQETTAAFNTLEGALSQKISEINHILISCSAKLSAWVDYPDDEIEELTSGELLNSLNIVQGQLKDLIKQFDNGKAIVGGVKTVIVGRPNVGKSTLMNMLLGEERSIVTSIAGTTRDIVEETAVIGSITLRLADTAGLHETEDEIEKIGVSRAKKCLEQADFVLAVFEMSQPLNEEDKEIIELIKGKKAVAILNKSDLNPLLDRDLIDKSFEDIVEISAKTGVGKEAIAKSIEKALNTAEFNPSVATLLNERQLSCTQKALEAVKEAIFALENGITLDAVNVSIDDAVEKLLVLTGGKASDAVIAEIFSKFCVGK